MTEQKIKTHIEENQLEWSSFTVLLGILRRKKFIIYFVLITSISAIIISFLMPKWYQSKVSLLPPKNQGFLGGIGALSSVLKEISPVGANKFGSQSQSYNYLAILNSRRTAEELITKFALQKVYEIQDSSMEETIKELGENFSVEVASDGTIFIYVYDKDPIRAAQMANYMVVVLNDISLEMASGEARSNKEFLEKRVTDNKNLLKIAEEKLKEFQEKNGIISISEDSRSSVNAMSDLFAKRVRLEIELGLLQKTSGVDNPAYRQVLMEKNELEKQLAKFPNLGLESIRLFREVLIQQKIMEFLVPLYEQARIDEQKDIPVILTLDKAVPAEKKARPKRLFIVASTFFASLVFSISFIVIIDRFRLFKSLQQGKYQKLLSAIR